MNQSYLDSYTKAHLKEWITSMFKDVDQDALFKKMVASLSEMDKTDYDFFTSKSWWVLFDHLNLNSVIDFSS